MAQIETGHYFSIKGKGCEITIEPRPAYCDRGNFYAKVHELRGGDPTDFPNIDGADMWPRYYFDLDRAKAECEAWLDKRGQLVNRDWEMK